MATIVKKPLKNGVSYRIITKVKNLRTDEFEAKSMTWHQPEGMTDEEAKREVKRIAIDFEEKARKEQKGFLVNDNNIIFIDFANKWLERISTQHSYNYVRKAETTIKLLENFFGKIKLKDITPVKTQAFIDSLLQHRVQRTSARAKKDLRMLLKSKLMKVNTLCELSGVKRGVYEEAAVGHNIGYDKALKLSKALKVDFDEYFEKIEIEHSYAKESVTGHKRILATILASAKKQRLVEHNYASSDYIEPIRGYKKEILILNDKEAKILMQELEKEENPRYQISIMIILLMGIRRGELAGLEWKDIDFDKRTMHIRRSCFNIGNKWITKEPKTETSKRLITMPNKLIKYLLQYKEWWEHRKSILKDIWKDCDRLLIADEGSIITPAMYCKWLHRILERANLPQVTLHSIRHTNITLQLIAGVDIKTVATRAGHARASTTSDFYSHFIKSGDQKASNTIDTIFQIKE